MSRNAIRKRDPALFEDFKVNKHIQTARESARSIAAFNEYIGM